MVINYGWLFSFVLFIVVEFVISVMVYTKNGVVNGTEFLTFRGKTLSAFLGIPYAKPPTGNNRFQEPLPIEKWEGIRTAHDYSSKCIQYTYHKLDTDPILGDEDCLYLNIFTPNLSNSTKLNVLVYIHGGAFMFGSGDSFTPYYILDYYDTVFVTINYRVGPFGFLTTGDEVIPGNIGMKDQVLALKWIQSNIEQFGGDKTKIILTGMSAGGASVHLHYFSSMSRNLFSKGISLSGTAFCPWVLAENSKMKAKMLAYSLDCPSEDSKQILDCLKLKDAKQILLQTEKLFQPWNYNPFSPFGPVVEYNSDSAFLNTNPYELLERGDVKDAPWLTSVTTEEGLYPGAYFITNDKLMQDLNDNWNKIAPHLLDYNHTIPFHQLNEVSEKIRTFYLGSNNLTTKSSKELIKMISDRLFTVDVERAARLQASVTKSPVYFYSFAYRGKYSLSNFLCKCNDDLGASHGDDLLYILKQPFKLSVVETEEDKRMMGTMINIWISFMESGVPSTSAAWNSVSPDAVKGGNISYVLISSSQDIKTSSSNDLSNRKFWDSIPFSELWRTERKNKKYPDEL